MVKETFALDSVPKESYFLGLAGTIPYLATSVSNVYLSWALNTEWPTSSNFLNSILMTHDSARYWLSIIEPLQMGYGAVIISFLGAIHWGLEYAEKKPSYPRTRFRYGLGVLASVVAWPTLFMPWHFALTSQFAAFVGLYFADSRASVRGWAPYWYGTYRFVLTAIVGVAIMLSLIGRAKIGDTAPRLSGLSEKFHATHGEEPYTDKWAKAEVPARKAEKKRKQEEEKKQKQAEEAQKKKEAEAQKEKEKEEAQEDDSKDSNKNAKSDGSDKKENKPKKSDKQGESDKSDEKDKEDKSEKSDEDKEDESDDSEEKDNEEVTDGSDETVKKEDSPKDSSKKDKKEDSPEDSGKKGKKEDNPEDSDKQGNKEDKPDDSSKKGKKEDKPDDSGKKGEEAKPEESDKKGKKEDKSDDSGKKGKKGQEDKPDNSDKKGKEDKSGDSDK